MIMTCGTKLRTWNESNLGVYQVVVAPNHKINLVDDLRATIVMKESHKNKDVICVSHSCKNISTLMNDNKIERNV